MAQVKGNQKTLLQQIQCTAQQVPPLSSFTQQEKGHGRISLWQTRLYDASQNPKAKEWKGLQSFIHVHREITKKGITKSQEAYFISDLILDAPEFHQGIRQHWGIENRLHWVKDVVHGEDANGIRKGNGPMNVAIFGAIAINVHRKNGNDSITVGQIKFGANVKELFKLLRT